MAPSYMQVPRRKTQKRLLRRSLNRSKRDRRERTFPLGRTPHSTQTSKVFPIVAHKSDNRRKYIAQQPPQRKHTKSNLTSNGSCACPAASDHLRETKRQAE